MAVPENLRVQVGDLLKRFGAQRNVTLTTHFEPVTVGATAIEADAPIDVDFQLERISEGIVVRGTASAPWVAPCSRCTTGTSGQVVVGVDELFEPEPVPGETYQLDGEILDLEPMIRDVLVIELPQTPLCQPDCAGLCPQCGIDRNVETCDCVSDSNDPRWAALQSLDLD